MSAAGQVPHGYHQAPQGNGANAERRQEQLPLVLIPSTWDVLFGRGMPIHQRPGNVRFHRILHPLRERYKNAPRDQKAAIVQQAIAVITSNWMIPPGTGTTRVRFLKRAPTNEYENLVQGQGNNEDNESEEEEEEDVLRTLQWVEATEAEAFEKVRHVLRDPKPAARMAAQSQMQMQHTTAAPTATFPTATYVPVMTNGFVMVPAAATTAFPANPNMMFMNGNATMMMTHGNNAPNSNMMMPMNNGPNSPMMMNGFMNHPGMNHNGGFAPVQQTNGVESDPNRPPMISLDITPQDSPKMKKQQQDEPMDTDEPESSMKSDLDKDDDHDDNRPKQATTTTRTAQSKDVLFGKGPAKNIHPGNVRFRELLLKSFRQSYVDAARQEKQEIIARAWDAVKKDGKIGRFLKQDAEKRGWKEATEQEIKDKIGKVLRQPYFRTLPIAAAAAPEPVAAAALAPRGAVPGTNNKRPRHHILDQDETDEDDDQLEWLFRTKKGRAMAQAYFQAGVEFGYKAGKIDNLKVTELQAEEKEAAQSMLAMWGSQIQKHD